MRFICTFCAFYLRILCAYLCNLCAHPMRSFYIFCMRILYVLSTYSVRILCVFCGFYAFCAFYLRIVYVLSVIFDGVHLGKILQPWRLKTTTNPKKAGRGALWPIITLILAGRILSLQYIQPITWAWRCFSISTVSGIIIVSTVLVTASIKYSAFVELFSFAKDQPIDIAC